AGAEQTIVEFDGDSNLKRIASVGLSHRVWDNLGTASVSWQQAGISMTLRDAPLWGDRIRANADLFGFRWFDRPGSARFRPGVDTQLYVFGLDARYYGDSVVAAVGRFQPNHAPGVLVLDGVQLGARDTAGFEEIGVYGGGYPDLVDIGRTVDRWTAGLYYHFVLGDHDGLSIDHDARVAVVQTPSEEMYYEAQPRVRLRIQNEFELTGELRVGLEEASIDGGRASLWVPLGEEVQITGNYRYYSERALLNDAIGPRVLLPGSTQHADAAFQWQPSPWLIARATSWYAFDEQTDRDRLMIGPEVVLPTGFFGYGSLSAGYREEFGWLTGRTVFMQAVAEPAQSLSIVGRVSYFNDTYERELAAVSFDEIGLYGNLRWALDPRFTLEFSLLSRAGLTTVLEKRLRNERLGLTSRLALTGWF
ncbi:MAG: hypothetical protein AAF658_13080, partial [Myxococcota bacterium]